MGIMSKATRTVWKRKAKSFWIDFSHNKIGIVGLILLLAFFVVAIFAPYIAPYSQEEVFQYSPRQADRFAYPDWIGLIAPNLADLPQQTEYTLNWSIQSSFSGVEVQMVNNTITLYYNASKVGTDQPIAILLNSSFEYPYAPMRIFRVDIPVSANPDKIVTVWKTNVLGWKIKVGETGSMSYIIALDLYTPDGTRYPLWDQNWDKYKTSDPYTEPAFWSSSLNTRIFFDSDLAVLAQKLGFNPEHARQLGYTLFQEKGVYNMVFNITLEPGVLEVNGEKEEVPLTEATGNVTVGMGKFIVWGRRFGLLGTDGKGHDVFSQVVYGSGISLLIGISAALTSTFIGLLVGVTAGYLGGATDEALMRLVDILLCLPVLPVLLVLINILGYSVYYIVLIIAIFGWQGLSRVIRSQALSIRETAFVESAVAAGASKSRIMFKHLIPNVLPAAFTSFILGVPGAIILEAALSFIGFGDPFSPTWGKMLEFARLDQAYSIVNLAWWDILPPGICITLLCLSFVFIGHAVDEIVNPRLRRRR